MGGEPPPFPPTQEASSTRLKHAASARLSRVRFFLRVALPANMSPPIIGRNIAVHHRAALRPPGMTATTVLVATLSVTVVVPEPGTTMAGVKDALVLRGRPVQAKVIGAVNVPPRKESCKV